MHAAALPTNPLRLEASAEQKQVGRFDALKSFHPARAIGNTLLKPYVKTQVWTSNLMEKTDGDPLLATYTRLQVLSNDVSAASEDLATAAKHDMDTKGKNERQGAKLNVRLAKAAFTANLLQIRGLATPLVIDISQATNPALGGITEAAIHMGWFWWYTDRLLKAGREFPTATKTVGRLLHAEMLSLPYLDPGSISVSKHAVPNPLWRWGTRTYRHGKRIGSGQLASTAAYTAASILKGQSVDDQNRLRNATTVEGTIGSFIKGVAMGGLATVLGEGFRGFCHTPEGIVTLSVAPLAIVGLGKAADNLRQDLIIAKANKRRASNKSSLVTPAVLAKSGPQSLQESH
ncbi:MAG TPA: hypothetical protein VLG27_01315 [Candidatus Saccharimonadia bacterium]|nr:hypothetical protein [Candidatus Saccharimonadia bacterium]